MADEGSKPAASQPWWGEKFRHTEGRYAGSFPPAWVADGDERASEPVLPEERCLRLRELADAIVRGASIRHAVVPDLRALIEAVQSHPEARLAKIGEDGKPDIEDPTAVVIRGGEVSGANFSDLDIGVTLAASASFAGDAGFGGASFAGDAGFGGASFAGVAGFGGARFAGDAWFGGASFARVARFDSARFAGDAWFGGASFARVAWFGGASFAGVAGFDSASFAGVAGFGGARFAGDAGFDSASFAGDARFDGARFAGDARFGGASFAGEGDGDFRGTNVRTSLFAEAASDRVELARLRTVERRERKLTHRERAALWLARTPDKPESNTGLATRASAWAVQRLRGVLLWARGLARWPARGFGWKTVRGLGQLAILNRVSLVALIAVPALAAAWPAVQAAAGAYHREVRESRLALDRQAHEIRELVAEVNRGVPDLAQKQLRIDELLKQIELATAKVQEQASRWEGVLLERVSETPLLTETLALTFFAAVAVTLGLLIYQVASPEEVRKHDEDGFVDLIHKRYPEDAKDRNDGLRRAIEQLEAIAKVRPDRHASFVKHHGDTIWIPPRTRIDWFEDPVEEDEGKAEVAGAEDGGGRPTARKPARVPISSREGFVPGAERRRITIEEGARAEYWLKSRESVGWAWASFVLYLLGVGCLVVILVIQMHSVGRAAGWWG